MNVITTLGNFVQQAEDERKYAPSTARGFKAALKLFGGNLKETEQESLETLASHLITIANDIFPSVKDKGVTSQTLVVYQRRLAKLIDDYKQYGSSPGRMAAWNPRRTSSTTPKSKVQPAKSRVRSGDTVQEGEVIDTTLDSLIAASSSLTRPSVGGITSFDTSGKYVNTNRSEIYLRDGFKVTLELPTDLDQKEAEKLKQYIDLMVSSS